MFFHNSACNNESDERIQIIFKNIFQMKKMNTSLFAKAKFLVKIQSVNPEVLKKADSIIPKTTILVKKSVNTCKKRNIIYASALKNIFTLHTQPNISVL